VRRLALLITLTYGIVTGQSIDHWAVVQDKHFEVYSQADDKTVKEAFKKRHLLGLSRYERSFSRTVY
jgi:hypothetical protein